MKAQMASGRHDNELDHVSGLSKPILSRALTCSRLFPHSSVLVIKINSLLFPADILIALHWVREIIATYENTVID